jgi:hypothetical protein
MPTCSLCTSCRTAKNVRIHNGKQRFKCQECGRQFIEQPTKKVIDSATKELIDRLLLERISLAGIAYATQVSPLATLTFGQRMALRLSAIPNRKPTSSFLRNFRFA